MILGIIPSRYASTRFPGKPLALIHGKPMIQRVYEQAMKCSSLQHVVVATDDERIERAVKDFGGNAMMTADHHQSGTERCSEVIQKIAGDFDVVINIQGDEPFIQPAQIELLCSCFKNGDLSRSSRNLSQSNRDLSRLSRETQIATLIKKISHHEELFNSNLVKVVTAENGQAMYFSRSAIPHQRNVSENYWVTNGVFYKHIGIYGYRKDVLEKIVSLPPNDLEKAESLEQLRWLAHGYHIQTAITDDETIAIDTAEDLHRAEKFFPEK
ncbi:MAG TPA: 3-deoxy-manno-octulosonate cytidylyltransferase [Chitinophagales bacterium]|nr:3-deoxy-manno-octulosonate cytidylyltransferase [Chitinophagales bacterium]